MNDPSPNPASFESLLTQEALRGERLVATMRWWFMGSAFMVTTLMTFGGYFPQAGRKGMILLGAGLACNAALTAKLRRGLLPGWLSYAATTVDLSILSAYQYFASLHASPLAVATSATFLLYPMILFYVALRQKRTLLVYAVTYAIVSFNLAYFLRYPELDKALMGQVYASDPTGMALRSLYVLMFGVSMYFLPQTIRRLINRQAAMFEEQRVAERRHSDELEGQVAARTAQLREANQELQKALEEVKALSGLLPICTSCKKIRDDQGYWRGVEDYIRQHSLADFTHGICPECMSKIYPEVYERLKDRFTGPAEQAGAKEDPLPQKE